MTIRVPARLPRWNGIAYPKRTEGMAGLGQDDGGDLTDLPISYGTDIGSAVDTTLPTSISIPTSTTAGGTAPMGGGGSGGGVNNSNLTASAINSLIQSGSKIGTILAAEAAPGSLVYNPQTGQVVASSQSAAVTGALGGISVSTIMLLGFGLVLFMSLGKNK